jgi:polysaccharide biosynthesis transport protein
VVHPPLLMKTSNYTGGAKVLNRDITLDYLLQVVRRRKLAIVIPATIITTVVLVVTLLLPNVYLSDTVILVEPQQSVQTTTSGKPSITVTMERDRLATISQQILSRSRLEQIINEFGLYSDGPMEQRVKNMRDDIQLDVVKPDMSGNIGAFKVSYQNRDPHLASEVTNRLAQLFIDENTNSREKLNSEKARFLEDQARQAKEKLDEQEQRLQEFKQKHFDKLPDQREVTLKTIENLNTQLTANNDGLNRAQQQKVYVETMLAQYRAAPKTATRRSSPVPDIALVKVPTLVEKELEELKGELAELRNKYTDQHPDVIRTSRRVAELEQKRSIEAASVAGTAPKKSGSQEKEHEVEVSPEVFTTVATLNGQLRAADAEIRERAAEQNRLQSQLNFHRSRLELSPATEQELATLTQEYNVAKDNYQAIANEQLSSQMAEDLDRKQKTMLFRVLDPAKQPEKPYKPNRRALALFGLLAGLGAGFGIAFYREFTDESLRTEKDVETALGLEVLAIIPQAAKS